MTLVLVIFIFNLSDPNQNKPAGMFEIRPDLKIIFQQKFYF